MKEFKVKVHQDPWTDDLQIAFLEYDGRDTWLAKPLMLTMEPLKEGARIEPTLKIPRPIAPQFMKALSEAVDQSGVRPPSMELLRGQLKATEYHLADLRRLLKLKP